MIKFTLIFLVFTLVLNIFVKIFWIPYYEEEIRRHLLGLQRNYKAMMLPFIVVLLNIATIIFLAIMAITLIVKFL